MIILVLSLLLLVGLMVKAVIFGYYDYDVIGVHDRVVWVDVTTLYNLDRKVNALSTLFTLLVILMIIYAFPMFGHSKHYETIIHFVHNVHQHCRMSISQVIISLFGALYPPCSMENTIKTLRIKIKYIMFVFNLTMPLYLAVVGFIFLVNQFKAHLYVWPNLDRFLTFQGLLDYLILQANLFALSVASLWGLCASVIFVIFMILFTIVLFQRLQFCEQLLYQRSVRTPSLLCFMNNHNQCVQTILSANRITGNILLGIFLVNYPAGAFQISLLIVRPDTPLAAKMLIMLFIFYQFVMNILIHILSVKFTQRIPRFTSRAFHLSCRRRRNRWATATGVRFAHYIERYYHTNQYGLSYGKVALITSASFAKVGTLGDDYCLELILKLYVLFPTVHVHLHQVCLHLLPTIKRRLKHTCLSLGP